jgi:hypothetical protein
MVNISLSEKEALELVEFYEAEYEKQLERLGYLKAMLDKLRVPDGLAPVKSVSTPAAPEDVEAEDVKPGKGGKTRKPRATKGKKGKAAEEAKEEEPKAKVGRGGYLRLDYEKFILATLAEQGRPVHTNEFQQHIVAKNKLKGELVKKAEAGISRALSILKNQKHELRSVKVEGKAGLSYGLVGWFNEDGEYVKE